MKPFMNIAVLSNEVYSPVHSSEDEYTDDVEKKPFLRDVPTRKPRPHRTTLYHVGFAISYCALITFVLLALGPLRGRDGRPAIIYTPARPVMNYMLKGPIPMYPDHYHSDPYFGDPSPELDMRWIERLKYATIRLSHQEFLHYNQSGILLGDNSGYLATPTVYHDLHCIRALHFSLYPSYYFPNETEAAHEGRMGHLRHCLHNLAHSVECNPDMTIRVMRWHPNSLLPSPLDHDHECINWQGIEDWAAERYVDTGAEGMLIHPEKGVVFPKIEE